MPSNDLELLSADEVRQIVQSSFDTDDFVLNSFSIKPLSDHMVGFLGEHRRLTVTVNINGQNIERNFFIKSAPSGKGSIQYDLTVNSGAFRREINNYTKVIKELEKIDKLNDKNGNYSDRWCPKFHYNRGDELLVLDDISEVGFTVAPEREPLDKAHVIIGLQTLAKMHSSMYAAERILSEKKKNGKIYTESPLLDIEPDLIKEIVFTIDDREHPFTKWYETIVESYHVLTDYIDGYTDLQKEIVRNNVVSHMKEIVLYVKPSLKYRNIILHGDIWSNNILFLYENNKPVAANIVDFQLTRYGSPVHDVMDFLHLGTTDKLRMENEHEFQQSYYKQFEAELKKFGYDVKDFFTWNKFIESWEYYRKSAIIKAIIIHSFVLTPPCITDVVSVTPERYNQFVMHQREYYIRESLKDNIYKTRLCENFKELIDRYVLVKSYI